MDLSEWDSFPDEIAVKDLVSRINAPEKPSRSQKTQLQLQLVYLFLRRSLSNPLLLLSTIRELVPILESSYQSWAHRINPFADRSTLWLLYETGCIAAMELCESGIRNDYLSALEKEMPQSLRVRKLRGMVLENAEMFEEARDTYRSILEKEPTQVHSRKRLTSILLQQGLFNQAVKSLNEYLTLFSEDFSAWEMLYVVYTSQNMLPEASYVCEELITISPHSHVYSTMYGDVLYSMSSMFSSQQVEKDTPSSSSSSSSSKKDNKKDKNEKKTSGTGIELSAKEKLEFSWQKLTLAMKYYINSLDLKLENNLRASVGILSCLRRLRQFPEDFSSSRSSEAESWSTLETLAQSLLRKSVPESSIFLKESLRQWIVDFGSSSSSSQDKQPLAPALASASVEGSKVPFVLTKSFSQEISSFSRKNRAEHQRMDQELAAKTAQAQAQSQASDSIDENIVSEENASNAAVSEDKEDSVGLDEDEDNEDEDEDDDNIEDEEEDEEEDVEVNVNEKKNPGTTLLHDDID